MQKSMARANTPPSMHTRKPQILLTRLRMRFGTIPTLAMHCPRPHLGVTQERDCTTHLRRHFVPCGMGVPELRLVFRLLRLLSVPTPSGPGLTPADEALSQLLDGPDLGASASQTREVFSSSAESAPVTRLPKS